MLATVFLDIQRVNVSDVKNCFYFSETYITDKVTSSDSLQKTCRKPTFLSTRREICFQVPNEIHVLKILKNSRRFLNLKPSSIQDYFIRYSEKPACRTTMSSSVQKHI